MNSVSYLRWYGAVVAVSILGFVGLNWVIDPYGAFGGPVISGINDLKPEYDLHLALAKTLAVGIVKPRTIILGSSRANEGLDPDHPGFIKDGYDPVFNLAIDGGNMYEAMRLFQHAHAIRPLKTVVLAIDFFMFNAYFRDRPDFDEKLLLIDEHGDRHSSTEWQKLRLLMSYDTAASSVKTLRNESANNIQPYGPLGPRKYGRRWLGIADRGGQRQEFIASEDVYICNTYRGRDANQYGFVDAKAHRNTLDQFRKIVALALKDHVRLIIVVSPAHARMIESINTVGLWLKFEEWKRALVRIVSEEEGKVGKQEVALWDFTGYAGPVAEEVPADGDKVTRMQFYWESSHYTKMLGDRVLNRVLGVKSTEDQIFAKFGVQLTEENIEPHLAKIRQQQVRWQVNHSQDVAEIAAIAKRCGKIAVVP